MTDELKAEFLMAVGVGALTPTGVSYKVYEIL